MKTKQILEENYNYFSNSEGNQHIASEYAIKKLQKLIEKFCIENVLEIGLGIGSISGSLLKANKHLNYSGTENNSYCLNALEKNLGNLYPKLKIYSDIEDISEEDEYDLIIIDGKDENLKEVQNLISANGIIAIEGDRLSQNNLLLKLFPTCLYVHSISLAKNIEQSPFPVGEWQGGLKIIFPNPTSKQKLWWGKEKILTKMKYHFPGRHFGKRVSKR